MLQGYGLNVTSHHRRRLNFGINFGRRRNRVCLHVSLNLGLDFVLDFEIECVFKQFLRFRCLRNILHVFFGNVLTVAIPAQNEVLRALNEMVSRRG